MRALAYAGRQIERAQRMSGRPRSRPESERNKDGRFWRINAIVPSDVGVMFAELKAQFGVRGLREAIEICIRYTHRETKGGLLPTGITVHPYSSKYERTRRLESERKASGERSGEEDPPASEDR